MKYKHLTQEERYQIYALCKAEIKPADIAKLLNRNPATIYRELSNNKGKRGYRPQQANNLAIARKANNARKITNTTWQFVNAKLAEQWSPEQISACADVSHESIYQHIYQDKLNGGELYLHLRRKRKRRKRQQLYDRRGSIPNINSIHQRPECVEKRTRIGDFEVDTVIGKNHKQALVTINDRVTGRLLMAKVKQKTADNVASTIIRLLLPIKDSVKTITSDRGHEFAKHEYISKSLGCDFYFADPYSSWQRGSNENLNGLVRQYFPKGCRFDIITDEMVAAVVTRLNNRPRKRFKYKTPIQVWKEKVIALHT